MSPAQQQGASLLERVIDFTEYRAVELRWTARALSLLFFAAAWLKVQGDLHIGGVQLLHFEGNAEPGSEDETMYVRATALLLAFIGIQLILVTLPPSEAGGSGGAARRERERLVKED